ILPAGKSELNIVYTIYGSGDIVVDTRFTPGMKLPDLPRFGMQMQIPGRFNKMTWFGRGPHESYWDRKTGAAIGIWEGSVEDQIHPYIFPQETGNKTDVRWVTWTDSQKAGLLVVGMPGLSISAWPFTMQDLERAEHTFDLNHRRQITVNIDHKQMGLGGDNSWGARTHPEYRLPAKPYQYRFRLRPLDGSEKEIDTLIHADLPGH
ncbi:hypothetical protein BVY01_04905, partial [bacterium I07]